jgi:hypothetical protein
MSIETMFLSIEPRTAARVVRDVEFWDEEFYAHHVQPVAEHMLECWDANDRAAFENECETYQPWRDEEEEVDD